MKDAVRIDVQNLGEYFSVVSRVRVSRTDSHVIIWDLHLKSGSSQVWTFDLKAGENPVQPEGIYGMFEAVAPQGKKTFSLERGVRYSIEVSGNGNWRSRGYFEITP